MAQQKQLQKNATKTISKQKTEIAGLHSKLEKLESEKAELKVEVDRLRKEAEGKAVALECEVAVLREEAESLKKMLDVF